MDVLTLQQSGFSAIAPMGTALTQDQCDLLKRFADHVILVYDGDSAGRAAAVKAVPLVLNAGLNGTVVLLPDGEDPDTLVRQQGPGALQALIERGKPLFEAYLEDAVATHDDPAAVFERVRPVLALLPTEFDREQGRKRTAELLGTLNSEAARYLRVTPTPAASAPLTQTIPQRKAPAPERELLGILLQHPELIPFWRQRSDDALTHHTISDVVEQMVAIHDRLGRFDMLELMEWLTARGMERFVPHLMRLQQKQLYPDGWQSAFVEIADHLEAEAQKRRERAELVESVRNRDWSKSEESQHEHP